MPNIEIVRLLLELLGKAESLITFVADRPGHDRRYAIDATRIRDELGWAPRHRLPRRHPRARSTGTWRTGPGGRRCAAAPTATTTTALYGAGGRHTST